MNKSDRPSPRRKPFDFDLDELLHPARAFGHPRDVIDDLDLTINEKRAILASWVSDACAIEAAPALRQPPGAGGAIAVDEILDALRRLDQRVQQTSAEVAWARRQVRRQSIRDFLLRRPRSEPGRDLSH
jgi:hypothetical protein